MQTILKFDPTQYPERVLRLIMKKAEEWKCTPSEALSKLFDKLADDSGIPLCPPFFASLQEATNGKPLKGESEAKNALRSFQRSRAPMHKPMAVTITIHDELRLHPPLRHRT